MKIGWIYWYTKDDDPRFSEYEPDSWNYKIIKIVYAEIEE